MVNEIFELQVRKSLKFYNVFTFSRAARPAGGVWGACAAAPHGLTRPPAGRKKLKHGLFLVWRMKHERGMSEVMHLELIVNCIYIHILTVNIFRYRIVVSETSQ